MAGIEVIPSAKRLIISLRDLGYDFSQAVADIVDNSITAEASRIDIDIEFEGSNSWVRIADNGTGMNRDQLREAMRYGSERTYGQGDLGKFGLGLKTASLSQCQLLTVASRSNPGRAEIAAFSWDLEHIERTNRWEVIPLDSKRSDPKIWTPLRHTTGTVVLWQRLDRILGSKLPYGASSRELLSSMCRKVELHLGMVFHRFLNAERELNGLEILLNGNTVQPWDPYCRAEANTKVLNAITLPFEHEAKAGRVLVEPYVLPHQDDFSSPEAFRHAKGPRSWNQMQGFYFYRADRMIQSGGWSDLRVRDEHLKLARVAISFPADLDEAFKINVAKMRVQMPTQLRDTVDEAVNPFVKLAREVYDKKTAKPLNSATNSSVARRQVAHPVGASNSGAAAPSSSSHVGQSLFTFDEWTERLLAAATDRERRTIKTVLDRMRAGVSP